MITQVRLGNCLQKPSKRNQKNRRDGYIRMCDCDATVRERGPCQLLHYIVFNTISYQYQTMSYQFNNNTNVNNTVWWGREEGTLARPYNAIYGVPCLTNTTPTPYHVLGIPFPSYIMEYSISCVSTNNILQSHIMAYQCHIISFTNTMLFCNTTTIQHPTNIYVASATWQQQCGGEAVIDLWKGIPGEDCRGRHIYWC